MSSKLFHASAPACSVRVTESFLRPVFARSRASHARHVGYEFTGDSSDIGLLGIDPFKISQLIRLASHASRNFAERENNVGGN